MVTENLNYLFNCSVSKSKNKYYLLDLNIGNTNKLKDGYNLEMAIKSTLRNHVKYDLRNVFTIVKPHQYPNEFETVNLYTDYPSLDAADVAQNIACHATMTEDPHHKYFLQYFKLRHEYLVNKSK